MNIDDKLSKSELNTLSNQYNNKLSLSTACINNLTTNINELSSSKKSVKFAYGTASPREAVIALTIEKFENVKAMGYTEYHIQVYREGTVKQIKRRYRHFEALAKELKFENLKFKEELPILPQKRWFQTKRWLNRFDDEYSYDRKQALQDYLRILIKNPIIVEQSKALRKFLDLPEHEQLKYPDDSKLRHFLTSDTDNSIIEFEPVEYIEDYNSMNNMTSSNQDCYDYDYNHINYSQERLSDSYNSSSDSDNDSSISLRDNSSLSSLELNRILSEKLSVMNVNSMIQSKDSHVESTYVNKNSIRYEDNNSDRSID